MDLHQLKAFIAVAEAGGFAAGAATLNSTPSSMTRAVANLESFLGSRLFHRTTRSVELTDTGQQLLARINPALDELNSAVDHIKSKAAAVTGSLRVAASVSFGQRVLAPRLIDFHRRYPQVGVELRLSDAVNDLVAERIDLAVRHGSLTDSSLIAQRLCEVHYRLVAAPAYLKKAARIARPEDVTDHDCLTFPYHSFRSSWRFSRGNKNIEIALQPKLRISNAAALAEAVKSGMGIALLPDWLIDRDLAQGDLITLLPNWRAFGSNTTQSSALWLVMPSRKFVPKKTTAFAQFVRGLMKDTDKI